MGGDSGGDSGGVESLGIGGAVDEEDLRRK